MIMWPLWHHHHLLAFAILWPLILHAEDCPVSVGELKVLENPINVSKTANTKVTTLQIKEDQYLGSLTCHVLRDTSNPIFDHFNATTGGLAFANAGVYDPYSFGKKLQRYYNCDIYLTSSDFTELAVDLEVVLILQPLIRRKGINVCDVPLITRQKVHIEFEGYRNSAAVITASTNSYVTFTGMSTILRKTSFHVEKVASTTPLSLRSSSTASSTTTTKRLAKNSPSFDLATDKSANNLRRDDDNNNLVDGFVVGRPLSPTSEPSAFTQKPPIQNRVLSDQGTTSGPKNPADAIPDIQQAGPGINAASDEASGENPTLFWVILGIILTLTFLFVLAIAYYCCPALCVPCFGDGYLSKTISAGAGGPLGTAKDLTFVSVLDKDGRPLRQASTVEVWNTQKNNIKSYPIIGNKRGEENNDVPNYAYFSNEAGHLQHQPRRSDFILTDDSSSNIIETGDRVTLVDKYGRRSPVLVRILRAVTPRTFSSRLTRTKWKSSNGGSSSSSSVSPPRIFEIVRDDQQQPGSKKDHKDVQILTLDHLSKRETFRREGDAEILELENEDNEDIEDMRSNESSQNSRSRPSRLDVLEEVDEATSPLNTAQSRSIGVGEDNDDIDYLIASEMASAEADRDKSSEIRKKVSDSKAQQTDFTYGQVNKKIQANTMRDEDQRSDIDEADTDEASSVLSQSLRSTRSLIQEPSRYRYIRNNNNSIDEVGFLNVAMHHLVQDEFQAKHRRSRQERRSSGGPKRRSRSQVDYTSDGSEGRYIVASRKQKKSVNYYNGNRTPSPVYNETKASLLRRRKNHKPNENEEADLEEVLRASRPPPVVQYGSLQDLSRIQHTEGVPFSKHNSTVSLNQGHQPRPLVVRRQNSEPLGVSI